MSPFFIEQSKSILRESGFLIHDGPIPQNFAHFLVRKDGVEGGVVCVDSSASITSGNLVLAHQNAIKTGIEIRVIVAKTGEFSEDVVNAAKELSIQLVSVSAVKRAQKATLTQPETVAPDSVASPPKQKSIVPRFSSERKEWMSNLPIRPIATILACLVGVAVVSMILVKKKSGDRDSDKTVAISSSDSPSSSKEKSVKVNKPKEASGEMDFTDLSPPELAAKLVEISDAALKKGFNFADEFGWADISEIPTAICEGTYIKDPTNPDYLEKVGGNFLYNRSTVFSATPFLMRKDGRLVYFADRDEVRRLKSERGHYTKPDLPIPKEMKGWIAARTDSHKRPSTGLSRKPLPITEDTPNHVNSRIPKLRKYYKEQWDFDKLYDEEKKLAETVIGVLLGEIPSDELQKIQPELNKIALTRTADFPAFVLGILPWIDKDMANDASDELEEELKRLSKVEQIYHLRCWRGKRYRHEREVKAAAMELVNRTKGFRDYTDDEIMWLFFSNYHPKTPGLIYRQGLVDAMISYEDLRPWLKDFLIGQFYARRGRIGQPWSFDETIQDWIEPWQDMRKAKIALERAWDKKPDRPEIAALMIQVSAGCSETPIKDMRMWFDRCVALRSDYTPAYQYYIKGITPYMHGSLDELTDFATLCVESNLDKTDVPSQLFAVQKRFDYEQKRVPYKEWKRLPDELFDAYYAGAAFKGKEAFRNIAITKATAFFNRRGRDDLMLKWFKLSGGNLDANALNEMDQSEHGILMKIQELLLKEQIQEADKNPANPASSGFSA